MKGSNSILAIHSTGEERLVVIVSWLVIREVNLTEPLAEKEREEGREGGGGESGIWFCKKKMKKTKARFNSKPLPTSTQKESGGGDSPSRSRRAQSIYPSSPHSLPLGATDIQAG
jgi:hypothetical protein